MKTWKRDVRIGVLALLFMSLSALPWVWYGIACMNKRAEPVPAMADETHPVVALTFDDGPRRDTTPELLDGLARRGVHATFFVVGTRVEGQEELVLRMEEEGHQVAIHSQSHRALTGLSSRELCAEVEPLMEKLTQLLGRERFMIRPPYGFVDANMCRNLCLPIILWSVDPADWSDHDSTRQYSAIVNAVKDGDIILLHDIYHASVETALQTVDALMAEGYRFVTVEEMFALRGTEAEAGCVYRSLPPG